MQLQDPDRDLFQYQVPKMEDGGDFGEYDNSGGGGSGWKGGGVWLVGMVLVLSILIAFWFVSITVSETIF